MDVPEDTLVPVPSHLMEPVEVVWAQGRMATAYLEVPCHFTSVTLT